MKRLVSFALALALLVSVGSAAQILEEGASGETVMVLTRKLCELGYMTEPQVNYDEFVAQSVRDFQTANAVEVTGVADLATQQLMSSDDVVTRAVYITAFSKKYAEQAFRLGDEGTEVKRLQQALAVLGYYSGSADAKFGEGTRRAVEEYQRANGLNATGRADASTLIRLYDGISVSRAQYVVSQCAVKGDAGANVKSIQDRLNELGYFSGDSTGVFGDFTQKAVVSFQTLNSLPQTGEVDERTYEALFSASAISADESALYPGDAGDDVFSLQTRLANLGFLTVTPNGAFQRSTETAVMLFCIANGRAVTRDVSGELLALINADTALDSESLPAMDESVDPNALLTACATASDMVGEGFEQYEGELFPGFEFVRYSLASAGIAVLDPGEVISGVGVRAYSASDIRPGDIVMLGVGSGDAMTRTFTLCVDGGMLAYVSGSVVAVSHIEDMSYSSAYLWRFSTDGE